MLDKAEVCVRLMKLHGMMPGKGFITIKMRLGTVCIAKSDIDEWILDFSNTVYRPWRGYQVERLEMSNLIYKRVKP